MSSAYRLQHPCWLANELWRTLHLDDFFGARLSESRAGTDWEKVLRILVIYRLLSPGSEWRLHRQWFSTTALADLLGVNERAVQDDTLYRCQDLLLAHKDPKCLPENHTAHTQALARFGEKTLPHREGS